jgi:hypothetical protein
MKLADGQSLYVVGCSLDDLHLVFYQVNDFPLEKLFELSTKVKKFI